MERITAPRRTWWEAGKKLDRAYLEDRHLEAGIGYSPDKLYHFEFATKRGKWISRYGYATADEALQVYRQVRAEGHNPTGSKD